MLLVEGSSNTRLFRHLSDYVFGVRNFENILRSSFYKKSLKFKLDFRNAAQNSEKKFKITARNIEKVF